MVDSCAFLPCEHVERCALRADGRCVARMFPQPEAKARTLKDAEGLKMNAPALNGTKGRASRDPRFIKRRRKAL